MTHLYIYTKNKIGDVLILHRKTLSFYRNITIATLCRHIATVVLLFIALSSYRPTTCLYGATISNQRVGCVDMNRIMEEYPEAKKIKDELSADLSMRKKNIKNFEAQIDLVELEIKQMEEQFQKYNEEQKKIKENQNKIPIVTTTDISSSTCTDIVDAAVESSKEDIVVKSSSEAITQISSSTGTDIVDAAVEPSEEDVVRSSSETIAQTLSSTENTVVESSIEDIAVESSEEDAVVKPSSKFIAQISSPTFTIEDIEAKEIALEEQKSDLEKYIIVTKQEEKTINSKVKKKIMGKIYDIIKETCDAEGLTVLVDSCNLIYGEDAQDITEKVLKKLK
ncbi:MAG: OmpH family outer membrane protein [Elusimicrobiota bacterium]